jgi:virulence factor Mce-like protein
MRRHHRQANRLTLALVGIVVITLGVYGIFTKRIPFLHGYQVKAVFQSSNQLTPGFSPVRIAGVPVGKVTTIEDGPGATSVVTMELSDDALPLHSDARARIRPRLFLEGGFSVEIQPGSPSAPELDDGDTIPASQTAQPVQLHQILSAFDSPTRDDFRTIIKEFDVGLGNGGAKALGKAFGPLVPVLRDTAWIAEAARGVRPRDLSETISSTSRITAALASRDRQLSELVTNLTRTTTAFASRDAQLGASIREIDLLLRDAPDALDRIDRALPSLDRFIAELRPSLRAAPPVLDHTSAVLTQAQGLVGPRELPRLLRALGPGVRELPRLSSRLGRLFPLVTPVTDCVRDKALPVLLADVPDGHLSTNLPVWQELAHAFVGLASANQNFDGNGYSIRYLAGAGEQALATGALPGLGSLAGLTEESIIGSRPVTLGPSTTPPLRPDQPCTEQDPVDLSQRTTGGVAPTTRAVQDDRRPLTVKRYRSAVKRALGALREEAGE